MTFLRVKDFVKSLFCMQSTCFTFKSIWSRIRFEKSWNLTRIAQENFTARLWLSTKIKFLTIVKGFFPWKKGTLRSSSTCAFAKSASHGRQVKFKMKVRIAETWLKESGLDFVFEMHFDGAFFYPDMYVC